MKMYVGVVDAPALHSLSYLGLILTRGAVFVEFAPHAFLVDLISYCDPKVCELVG